MVAIKDLEMPKDCKKCPLMGTDGIPTDYFKPMMCVTIWATKHEIKHCIGGKILNDCPLVEVEERKVGEWKKNEHTFWTCSECGLVNKYNRVQYAYCPNCGAKMVGAENE